MCDVAVVCNVGCIVSTLTWEGALPKKTGDNVLVLMYRFSCPVLSGTVQVVLCRAASSNVIINIYH